MARSRGGRRNRSSDRLWKHLGRQRPCMDVGRSTNKYLAGVLGKSYQEIFQRRKRAGPPILSRCDHSYFLDTDKKKGPLGPEGRLDSMQAHFFVGNTLYHDPNPVDHVTPYLKDLCCRIERRFVIYGAIGKGTFGYILAAREKTASGDGAPVKHYAIKVEDYKRIAGLGSRYRAAVANYKEVSDGTTRYIPSEALVMQFVAESDRFPRIDSVYIHGNYTSIIMSADAVDQSEERETAPPIEQHPIPVFRGFNGEQLMHKKRVRLNEIQACKIASQLLEALTYLMDMNMTHDDLSHRNYLVDKNLNIQLIDLESIHIAEKEKNFMMHAWTHIPAFEYMMAPELTLLFTRAPYNSSRSTLLKSTLDYKHDIRVEHLWKFGVLVYDLLHGYSPWEPPEYDRNIGELKELYTLKKMDLRMRHILDRRIRIMNEELPIDERLSQDCVDALRVLLARNIGDRATLSELAALPWFQGHWADHPTEAFQRPPGRKKARKSEFTPSA